MDTIESAEQSTGIPLRQASGQLVCCQSHVLTQGDEHESPGCQIMQELPVHFECGQTGNFSARNLGLQSENHFEAENVTAGERTRFGCYTFHQLPRCRLGHI